MTCRISFDAILVQYVANVTRFTGTLTFSLLESNKQYHFHDELLYDKYKKNA